MCFIKWGYKWRKGRYAIYGIGDLIDEEVKEIFKMIVR